MQEGVLSGEIGARVAARGVGHGLVEDCTQVAVEFQHPLQVLDRLPDTVLAGQ